MKILALDTSGRTASVAITEDSKLIYESFVNAGLTHSQTVTCMIENALAVVGMGIKDIEVFALTEGPGSFTGLRIGAAAVKGLAAKNNTPCVGVSTLEALSWNMAEVKTNILALLDARRSQFYYGVFSGDGSKVSRLRADGAEDGAKILEDMNQIPRPLYLVGDGARIWYDTFVAPLPEEKRNGILIGLERTRFVNGYGVALAALKRYKKQGAVKPEEIRVQYLRLPQAQRELNAKQG